MTSDASAIKKEMVQLINTEPLADIEYIELVNIHDAVEKIVFPVALCVAVRIGKTRLIDNVIVDVKPVL
jgi:pantoate--beta-alanine ligase